MAPSPSGPDTIVLIHGLWMTPPSWEKWIAHFESAGYTVIAPSWPQMEGEPAELRAHPDALKDITVEKILDHYEHIIRELDKPPIIMGHSFGGAFVQLLLDRGLGAAGVAVSSATVRGIPDLPLSTLRSTFPVLSNPLNVRHPVPITPEQFHYAFTNTLSEEESQPFYDRYAVPAASKVLFAGALANVKPGTPFKVDFSKADRTPLLFIGGTEDHVTPSKVVRKNAKKYGKSGAEADYREFPGRSHNIVGQDGWEEVADFALAWAEEHARPVEVATPA
jgi:pimeloyl-ACP methyl ester carboxylesterase